MKVDKLLWSAKNGWSQPLRQTTLAPRLILIFGSRYCLEHSPVIGEIRTQFRAAEVVGCSSSGQIVNGDVSDDVVAVMLFEFDATTIRTVCEPIASKDDSFSAGHALARALDADGLRNILLLSDGLNVNGSALIDGMKSVVGDRVVITGGLAGDGADFTMTVVLANATLSDKQIVAVGFYGDALVVGHGSVGGWDEFGPPRVITKSTGNVLYALDGAPALDLYKHYLGEEAAGLPGTGLLYPLLVSNPKNPDQSVVRTILAVDEAAASMTFAGDVPQGWTARLMRGNFTRLAQGAAAAATAATSNQSSTGSAVAAIMISCVGRRILMGESIIDEVAAADAALGPDVCSIGYYSYGEISPHAATGSCQLHNQTMTVTTLSEAL